jgi:hypothetical protein
MSVDAQNSKIVRSQYAVRNHRIRNERLIRLRRVLRKHHHSCAGLAIIPTRNMRSFI